MLAHPRIKAMPPTGAAPVIFFWFVKTAFTRKTMQGNGRPNGWIDRVR